MNILRTPDDSTAVVRIMGEFDQFLSHDPKSRLTYEESSGDHSASKWPSKTLTKTRSQGNLMSKEREKDIELIKSRSKIAYLESEMNSLECERKRARIEYDTSAGNHQLQFRRMEEKYEDLQQNFQYLAQQEKSAKEQLKELKKEFETYKNKAEQKVQNLQREKLKACSERDEVIFFLYHVNYCNNRLLNNTLTLSLLTVLGPKLINLL